VAGQSALSDYWIKRDFGHTPEPKGRQAKKQGWSFVIQKHAASRLHFDFRLELDGVLKSWAVTKGPSLDPAEKRLAVRVEDHPLDYGDFEGTIPEGQYGGGTVMLWDRGTWTPEGDPYQGLKKGKLSFTLNGERLKGGFTLVRMRGDRGKRESWLLIKQKDEAANPGLDPVEQWQKSVATRRGMEGIAKGSKRWISNRGGDSKGREADLPPFVAPELAYLADRPPDGPNWIHEIKYGGYRVLAAIAFKDMRLYTRSGQDWTAKFAALAKALGKLKLHALIDGEVVVFDKNGRSKFSLLQSALSDGQESLMRFVAFDLLFADGEDLRGSPLAERKKRLKALLKNAKPPILFCDHLTGNAEKVLTEACRLGIEGLVSKDRNSLYTSRRSGAWIKSKCLGRSEFVIGGYRPSDKAGRPFASLLIGEFGPKGLFYRGRVGTGYNDKLLKSLGKKLKALEIGEPPFAEVPADIRRRARWVRPELVAEIVYAERTKDNILRHPAFIALREDKPAKSVKGEDRLSV
jgi:bifunctional non-homologous end joining protein LigD